MFEGMQKFEEGLDVFESLKKSNQKSEVEDSKGS